MTLSPFDAMQLAVDIVNSSQHSANKIAATVFGAGPDDLPFSVSRTNYWPPAIEATFSHDERFGNSSGTVHAETACLLATPRADGASISVTDPFCPNCAKNMAEAGITQVYIDHKGFEKDYATRRMDHFRDLSLGICARAGIAVYELHRKERRATPIFMPMDGFERPKPQSADIEKLSTSGLPTFEVYVSGQRKRHRGRRIAAALATNAEGATFGLVARTHPPPGYDFRTDGALLAGAAKGKYSLIIEPVNRLLMLAARRGLKLQSPYVFSSLVPTAREQVNLLGAGVSTLFVEHMDSARDTSALDSMVKLKQAGALSFRPML